MINRYPSEAMVAQIVDALSAGSAAITFESLRAAVPDIPVRKLQVALKMLDDAKLIKRKGSAITLLADADIQARAAEAVRQYELRAERDREILGAMVAYARSGQCRWRMLLDYFDDSPTWEHCDHCDSCELAKEAEALAEQMEQHAVIQTEADTPAPTAPAFRPGDRVGVRRYGAGLVEAVTRERVDIRFPDGSLRRFLPNYVRRLQHQRTTPPEKQAA
ncbi:RecQ family zinc-binding domain-containing protein [Candidimonas sp. SYP-B2681]|uniref:RecQ family zinc-binding domain-containing protein n=1 Tax=Candidimonas sp. SYP-B2681 TaxID=2497686 RepID=UPI001F3325B5|nr:RecQ family zinc-binding domain-containing protein [Candidimonas sp. SYP-B2681]